MTQYDLHANCALLHTQAMGPGVLELARHPPLVLVDDLGVVGVLRVVGIDAQRLGEVLVAHLVAQQQVAQVDGPRARSEALLAAHRLEVVQQLRSLLRRQNHDDAGQAAVPVVALLVVRQVVVLARRQSVHRGSLLLGLWPRVLGPVPAAAALKFSVDLGECFGFALGLFFVVFFYRSSVTAAGGRRKLCL